MNAAAASVARRRLREAGIELPTHTPPRANYLSTRTFGGVVYCAGVTSEGIGGRAGIDVDIADARAAARLCATRQLAALEAHLGSLDAVALVLRLTGYVACGEGFAHSPTVIDAASDVFIAAFGEAGRHARSAVGVLALPGNATVELEAVVGCHPDAGWA